MTNEQKTHFLEEQLLNYQTRKYRIEVEMEMLRTCQKDIKGYMTKSALEEKEEAVAKQVVELDVAIAICQERLAALK